MKNFLQVISTALLIVFVMAMVDRNNLALPKFLLPPMIGLIIASLNCSLAYNSGLAMNPARDLGPRLFTLVAGWGSGVFRFMI